MMLYLSRHGEASHAGPGAPSSLTPKGLSDVTRMAEVLAQKKKIKITALWHSPLTRAVQTGEIYRQTFGISVDLAVEKQTLAPDGDFNQTYQELINWKGGDLLIVSHLPFLPNLAALLEEGSGNSSSFSFPTAGVAAFELKNPFKFLWALDPAGI
jgi:phosphohistidine phosphatase SixA